MAVVLRYRFEPGMSLNYERSVTMMMARGEAEPVVGKAVLDVTLAVLERHPDGSWTVEERAAVREQTDPLPAMSPPIAQYRVTDRGDILGTTHGAPAFPWPVFPPNRLEARDVWHSNERTTQKLVAMEHLVDRIENRDETLVGLASEGTAAGDPALDIFSNRLFSLERGCFLEAKVLLKCVWSRGGQLSLVLEERLL